MTIEDSTFTGSAVSGLKRAGGRRDCVASRSADSKFEKQRLVGGAPHGNGMSVLSAAIVEDSAFWSNARDGIKYTHGRLNAGHLRDLRLVILGQRTLRSSTPQGVGAEALAPDGNVAGKPGNAIYDNGTFGFSLRRDVDAAVSPADSSDVDWRGTYWGPTSYIPAHSGRREGMLSYGAPDPNSGTLFPVILGPVSRQGRLTGTIRAALWCGNDDVLVERASVERTRPPFRRAASPVFGGIAS